MGYTVAQGAKIVSDFYALGRKDLYGEGNFASPEAEKVHEETVRRAARGYAFTVMSAPTADHLENIADLMRFADQKDHDTDRVARAAGDALQSIAGLALLDGALVTKIEQSVAPLVQSGLSSADTRKACGLALAMSSEENLSAYMPYLLTSRQGNIIDGDMIAQMTLRSNVDFEQLGASVAKRNSEDAIKLKHAFVVAGLDQKPASKADQNTVKLHQSYQDLVKGLEQTARFKPIGVQAKKPTHRI